MFCGVHTHTDIHKLRHIHRQIDAHTQADIPTKVYSEADRHTLTRTQADILNTDTQTDT